MDNTREYNIGQNKQKNYIFLFDNQDAQRADVVMIFHVQAHATLTIRLVVIDTSMRVKIHCVLQGDGAHVVIHGAYKVSRSNIVSIETILHHKVLHTSSTLVMKGVLRDAAQAHYQGTIFIEKEARGVCASQENKNIILSNEARAVSVPNLQVLNNDVRCFHGSAVGRFDEQQLLYAAVRGIDEKKAEQLLLEAFFADVVQDSETIAKITCSAEKTTEKYLENGVPSEE